MIAIVQHARANTLEDSLAALLAMAAGSAARDAEAIAASLTVVLSVGNGSCIARASALRLLVDPRLLRRLLCSSITPGRLLPRVNLGNFGQRGATQALDARACRPLLDGRLRRSDDP